MFFLIFLLVNFKCIISINYLMIMSVYNKKVLIANLKRDIGVHSQVQNLVFVNITPLGGPMLSIENKSDLNFWRCVKSWAS